MGVQNANSLIVVSCCGATMAVDVAGSAKQRGIGERKVLDESESEEDGGLSVRKRQSASERRVIRRG